MEGVEIEVVSQDTVTPSSPTPQHLSHYQLSFLDQISPPVHIPIVLFYSFDTFSPELDETGLSSCLKSSLSETLARFYPLAGRLKGNLYVDCNDEGVPFVETRVKCQLLDVIHNPDPKGLRKLVPFALDEVDGVCLGVQFNVFECGGIAVGICLSHKLGDGLSSFMFTKAWAAICRGEADVPYPEFVSAKLFPPINISGFDHRTGITRESLVSKRFTFKSHVIEALQAKYSKGIDLKAGERPPSRVEALSAFAWSRFAAATQVNSEPERTCYVLHSVNLRTKFEPPLPQHSFGNLYRVALTFLPPHMEEDSLDLVPKMRETIIKIDKEYVKKLSNGKDHLNFIKQRTASSVRREMSFNFSSFCRFPAYEADFGWGKPTWVGIPAFTFKNLIIFMDAKAGDGIEAYINLKEEDMTKLEKDQEFQAYVSPTTKNISSSNG